VPLASYEVETTTQLEDRPVIRSTVFTLAMSIECGCQTALGCTE
jgi:hypothetical protein